MPAGQECGLKTGDAPDVARAQSMAEKLLVSDPQILAHYPQLTPDGFAAAFRYAADALKGEHTWGLRITA